MNLGLQSPESCKEDKVGMSTFSYWWPKIGLVWFIGVYPQGLRRDLQAARLILSLSHVSKVTRATHMQRDHGVEPRSPANKAIVPTTAPADLAGGARGGGGGGESRGESR